MSLQTRLGDLITAIGTDYKFLRSMITGSSTGDLTGLTTTDKTSVVAAINETKAGNAGSPPDSSETVKGIIEIATQAEVTTGTDDVRALTPLKLATRLSGISAQPDSSETVKGIVELATQAETNTGTDDLRAITPLKFQTRLAAYAQPLDSDLTSIAALSTTTYGRAFLALADQAALMTLVASSSVTVQGIVELATDAESLTGTDTARATTPANVAAVFTDRIDTTAALGVSNVKVPSQGAVKAYADGLLDANNAMQFKGVIDASTNPNYPAASAGHAYKISVAGKIGGASGPNVEVGDTLYAITDGTAAGTQAAVGANWVIVQTNIDGAVTGPVSSVASNLPIFSGTTGKVIADSGFTPSNAAIGAGSATVLPTSAQVVAFSQPLDSDLTAIAALTTTAYGRAFLALANQAGLMALLSAASESASGIIEIATQAEVTTGTDDVRALTPLKHRSDLTTVFGNAETDLVALYTTAKA